MNGGERERERERRKRHAAPELPDTHPKWERATETTIERERERLGRRKKYEAK